MLRRNLNVESIDSFKNTFEEFLDTNKEVTKETEKNRSPFIGKNQTS